MELHNKTTQLAQLELTSHCDDSWIRTKSLYLEVINGWLLSGTPTTGAFCELNVDVDAPAWVWAAPWGLLVPCQPSVGSVAVSALLHKGLKVYPQSLKELDLSGTPVDSAGLGKIGQIVGLKKLWLSSTDLTNDDLANGLKGAAIGFNPDIFIDTGGKITEAGLLRLHADRTSHLAQTRGLSPATPYKLSNIKLLPRPQIPRSKL